MTTPSRSRGRFAPTLRDLADAGWSLLTTTLGLGIAIWVVDGAATDGVLPVLLVGVIVAGGDVLLRPILRPLAVAAGAAGALLAGVAAQILIVWAAIWTVPRVIVDGWLPMVGVLVVATLVMAAGRWLVGAHDSAYVLGDVLRRSRARARRAARDDDAGRGLLIIQIDGLSQHVLHLAIEAGLAPTMARWLRDGTHRLVPWWASVPSTTPASQAALLHGDSEQIPAFRWWDKELGRLVVTNRPADAALVERRLSDGKGLLAHGGVAVATVFSGDAPTGLLVMSQAGAGRGLGPGPSYLRFFASPFVFSRALTLCAAEMIKELYQAHRQRVRNVEPRVRRRPSYVLLRGVTNVLLRSLNVSLAAEHLLRRAPVVYVGMVDYDEIAHHAGPTRPEAMRALEGLDGVVNLLEQVAARADRDYSVVVLSDHGQSMGPTFRQVEGHDLVDVVRSLMETDEAVQATDDEDWGPLNTLLTNVLRRDPDKKPVVFGPGRASSRQSRAPAPPPDRELPEVAVVASGNLAMIWFPRLPGRVPLEEILTRWPNLVAGLASRRAVGVVVVQTSDRGPIAIGGDGVRVLRDGRVEGTDPLLQHGPRAAPDLMRAAARPSAGDLILVSAVGDDGQVHSFEEQVGSHGGLGGRQNEAVLLYPAELTLDEDQLETVSGRPMLIGAEAVHRQLLTWMRDLGLRP